ncbi:MAG TPA: class I SAM-dependent methyltransferase [Caulobacteraceae bacterium]|jgi:SAM-dependent methyltransferase|nr:class I SAM-dependent methyltransferase [Caulobacteraceae bacterium]
MSEPQVSALRRIVRRVSWALGVPDLLYRLQEQQMARAAPKGPAVHDGLPLPPALMRVMVIGTASPDDFLESGKAHLDEFEAVLAEQGKTFVGARAILDIGCGCGRLARLTIRRGGDDKVTGVDINRPMVEWCRRNLPGRWAAIRIGQALPFGAAAFDLGYACSVVTHLREDTTARWFADLARVFEPGGVLLVSFHDEHHPTAALAVRGGPTVRERLAQTGYAVEVDRMEGSNRLAAYATIERLADLAGPGFELLDYRQAGRTACRQAIAVFKRR